MNTAKKPTHSDNSTLKTMAFKTLEGYCFGFDGSKCEECGGKCCAGESGYVFLSIAEMQEIARFLGIEFEVFTQKYVRKVGYKFSLLEKIPKIQAQDSKNPKQRDRILDSCQSKNAEYEHKAQWSGDEAEFASAQTIQSNEIECIFFENGKCAIYPVRPKQCRDFPFWESHKILDADSKKALGLECKGIRFFS